MKKALYLTTVLMILAGLGLTGAAFGNGGVKGDAPAMMVSPQMIVLSKVDSVTFHTNIAEANVDTSTVTVNGVAPISTWADDRGHLAGRVAVADLELEPGAATLVLRGAYLDGGGFTAVDAVRVK